MLTISRSFICTFLLLISVVSGYSRTPNHPPAFSGGASQSIMVCQGASGTSFSSLLTITDADAGQTETWSVSSAPAHGTIVGLDATATSTGASLSLTSSGIAYTPAAGYTGDDVFTVQVSDGFATATTTIHVTVMALPDPGTISGPSSVCAAATITLTATVPGGSWSAADSLIAVSGLGEVVSLDSANDGVGVTSQTDTVFYLVTNACGSSVASKILTVNPLAFAGGIVAPYEICVGTPVNLYVTSAFTIIDTDGGTWTSQDDSIATIGAGGSFVGMSAGIDVVSYTVVNACDTSIAVTNINVVANPVAGTITGLSAMCPGYALVLSDSTATPGGIWYTSNASADVTADGVAIGVSGGIDTITYHLDNFCGTVNATKIITVESYPFAGVITGPTELCIGDIDTIFSSGTGGSWSTANAAAAITGSGELLALAAGIDTVSYIVTNICGTSATSVPIYVSPMPNTAVTIDSVICTGSAYTVTPAVTEGSWSVSNVHAIYTGGIMTGVTVGWDTLTYKVTNACATDSAAYRVRVSGLPVVSAITGSVSVCAGATISLAYATIGGTWSIVNTHASIASTAIVTGVSAGVDTVKYAVANVCGITRVKKTITVNTPATVGAISGLSAVCAGAAITLTDATTGGVWTHTNPGATVTSAGIVTGVYAGPDTIKYTVTNSCGPASSTKSISVNATPAAPAITGVDAICVGVTIPFTDSLVGGAWSSNSPHAMVTSAGGVKGISAGSDTIRYVVTNTCGADTVYRSVTINTMPVVSSITGADSVCPGQVVALSDATMSGIWNSQNNAIATVSSFGVVTGVTSGYDTVYYGLTNVCGTTSASYRIKVRTNAECNSASSVGTVTGNEEQLQLYPNPNSGTFVVNILSATDEPVEIVITSVTGARIKEIATSTNRENELSINVASGIYILSASTATTRHIAKITVE